ncbi:hypothetical protein [Ferdinandcohnia sp. Marseille-Q9671]
MFYESVSSAIYWLLFLWVVFLVFQRLNHGLPKANPWKKDIKKTFIQALVIMLLMPFFGMILDYYMN